jgi:DNA ligase D-like protein (predicted 3'-phosphoesterase)
MAVDDHSIGWGDFEGTIGEGQYGAGPVIVWDRGTYEPLGDAPTAEALDAGHASFWLEGDKLRGGWSLRRIRGGGKPQWLLVKRRDEAADARRRPTSTQRESVVSGRTIEQVAEEART